MRPPLYTAAELDDASRIPDDDTPEFGLMTVEQVAALVRLADDPQRAQRLLDRSHSTPHQEGTSLTVTHLVPNDPWVTSSYASCEGCGNSALRETPADKAPAIGTQYLCSRCVGKGVMPDLAEFEDEQLTALIADLTTDDSTDYRRRVLAAARKEVADREADLAKYDTVASFEANGSHGAVWSCQVQRRGSIHFELQFPTDEGGQPLALSALDPSEAEGLGKALLEAAQRARHQERHFKRL